MADETSLETRVTDAAAACAEEIAADEGWENDVDLTLTKLVIARHMRELIGVAVAEHAASLHANLWQNNLAVAAANAARTLAEYECWPEDSDLETVAAIFARWMRELRGDADAEQLQAELDAELVAIRDRQNAKSTMSASDRKQWHDAMEASARMFQEHLDEGRTVLVVPPGDVVERGQDDSLRRSAALPRLELSQQEIAAEVCLPPSGESPEADAAEADRLRQVLARTNDTICQTLAQALGGFAWYKDDQDHFPGATEANGVMVIEHTAEDLAELAAKRISELSARIRTMRTLGGLIDVYGSSMWNQGYTAAERGPITRTAEDAKAKINAILDGKPAAGDATMTLLPALKECELFLRVYGLDHPEIAELAANCRDVIAKATTEGGVS